MNDHFQHTLMSDIEAWGKYDYLKFAKLYKALTDEIQATYDDWCVVFLGKKTHLGLEWLFDFDTPEPTITVQTQEYFRGETETTTYSFAAEDIFAPDRQARFKKIHADILAKREEEAKLAKAKREEEARARQEKEEAAEYQRYLALKAKYG